MLFTTVNWPTISALAANLAYLYTLPLCIFFSSLYHNIVIQSTSLQHCDKHRACLLVGRLIVGVQARLFGWWVAGVQVRQLSGLGSSTVRASGGNSG